MSSSYLFPSITFSCFRKKSFAVFGSNMLTPSERYAGVSLTPSSTLAKPYEEPQQSKCVLLEGQEEPGFGYELSDIPENTYESLKETAADPALDKTGLHNPIFEDMT